MTFDQARRAQRRPPHIVCEYYPAICLVMVFAACRATDRSQPSAGDIRSVAITPKATTVIAGRGLQLAAVATDTKGQAVSVSFTWTSSDTTIATVSATGMVTAVSKGQATITAAVEKYSDQAIVTVLPEYVTLRLSKTAGVVTSLPEGQQTLPSGTVVSFSFTAAPGFANLRVILDTLVVGGTGQVVMNDDHSVFATADKQIALSGPAQFLVPQFRALLVSPGPMSAFRALSASIDQSFKILPFREALREVDLATTVAFTSSQDPAALAAAYRIIGDSLAVGTLGRDASTTNLASPAVIQSGIAFYYVNGVLTTPTRYKIVREQMLQPLLRDLGYEEPLLQFPESYNRSGLDTGAGFDAISQCLDLKLAALRGGKLSEAFLSLAGCFGDQLSAVPIIGDFLQSLSQFITRGMGSNGTRTALMTKEAVALAAQVGKDVGQGKKVVILAHSQGNMMVTDAIAQLRSASADLRCVGVVSVAPPARISTGNDGPSITELIIEGSPSEDILLRVAELRRAIGATPRVTNELSDETDQYLRSVPWIWLSGSVFYEEALVLEGLRLHDVAESYLGQDRTAATIRRAILTQLEAVNTRCGHGPALARISVESNRASSWTIQPGNLGGSGTSSEHVIAPDASGSVVTLIPAPLPGYTVSITNTDASGSTMVMWPGQTKAYTVNYVATNARPRSPYTRVRACPAVIETGVGISEVEVYVQSGPDAWLPGARISLSASGEANQFTLPTLTAPPSAPAIAQFRSMSAAVKTIRAGVDYGGQSIVVDTTVYVSNRRAGIALTKRGGDNQTIPVGQGGTDFVVEVRDAQGRILDGIPVAWRFANCFAGITLGGLARAHFVPPYTSTAMMGKITATVIGENGPASVDFFFRYIDPTAPVGDALRVRSETREMPPGGPGDLTSGRVPSGTKPSF